MRKDYLRIAKKVHSDMHGNIGTDGLMSKLNFFYKKEDLLSMLELERDYDRNRSGLKPCEGLGASNNLEPYDVGNNLEPYDVGNNLEPYDVGNKAKSMLSSFFGPSMYEKASSKLADEDVMWRDFFESVKMIITSGSPCNFDLVDHALLFPREEGFFKKEFSYSVCFRLTVYTDEFTDRMDVLFDNFAYAPTFRSAECGVAYYEWFYDGIVLDV